MLEKDNVPSPPTKKVKTDYVWFEAGIQDDESECGRFFTYTALPES